MLGTRGEAGCDERHFNRPADMVVTPEGDVFVADGYGNARIVHFDKNGKFVKSWGKLGTEPGDFSLPHAIALDSKGRYSFELKGVEGAINVIVPRKAAAGKPWVLRADYVGPEAAVEWTIDG